MAHLHQLKQITNLSGAQISGRYPGHLIGMSWKSHVVKMYMKKMHKLPSASKSLATEILNKCWSTWVLNDYVIFTER